MTQPAPSSVLRVRDHQARGVEAWHAADPTKGALFVCATGTGKTVLGHLIAVEYLKAGKRVVWLSHKIDLVDQPLACLVKWWPELRKHAGIVRASQNHASAKMVYASRDTLAKQKRMDQLLEHGQPDLIVVDEAHHSSSNQYRKVIDQLRGPHTRMLGLTATPDQDGAKLSDYWEVAFQYSILNGIADNVLIPPYACLDIVPDLNLEAMGGRKDYLEADLARELGRVHMVEHTVAAFQKLHVGQRLPFRDDTSTFDPSVRTGGALVFTASVQQAIDTAAALRDIGLRAIHVFSGTPDDQRRFILADFEAGRIDVICNAQVYTEGTDLPCCDRIYLARPTKSWSLFVQMVGRALRPFGAQTRAFVVDLVGATQYHSIVAAPVLVDGDDCLKSPDGKHRYLHIIGTFEGRCQHCGELVKCFARGGPHRFVDGVCKSCSMPQCPASSDGHDWFPWEEHWRKCIGCGAEIPDPTSNLKMAPKARESVAWFTLPRDKRVRTSHLGAVGILFKVDHGGEYLPYWFANGKMHRLAGSPVDERMSDALTDDVARRARKVDEKYGGRLNDREYRKAFMNAEDVWLQHKMRGGG